MRLIDADALLERAGDAWDSHGHLLYAVGTGDIMLAPTVDAVEVVRCKDCMFYDRGENECESWSACERVYYIDVSDNDFCSYGEAIK